MRMVALSPKSACDRTPEMSQLGKVASMKPPGRHQLSHEERQGKIVEFEQNLQVVIYYPVWPEWSRERAVQMQLVPEQNPLD